MDTRERAGMISKISAVHSQRSQNILVRAIKYHPNDQSYFQDQ